MNDYERDQFIRRELVFKPQGVDDVIVKKDVAFSEAESSLTMDLYYPSDVEQPLPAVVFVTGFPDGGFERKIGCKQKEMGSYISWAKALAASGMIAVTYQNHDPVEDIQELMDYLTAEGLSLGIRPDRIGIWSCSSNVPNALGVLMQRSSLWCAVLVCGFTLDLSEDIVSKASKVWGFVNPCAGKTISDLPQTPMLVVRAGNDEIPRLNESLDTFISQALSEGLPIQVINAPGAPHAFDLVDHSEESQHLVKLMIAFLQVKLGVV